MPAETREQMGAEARALMESHNKATDGTLVVEPEYLQVVARKRG
jgi:hypothetical protein